MGGFVVIPSYLNVLPVIEADTHYMPNAQGVDIGVTVSAVNDPAPGCFIYEHSSALVKNESNVTSNEPAEVKLLL